MESGEGEVRERGEEGESVDSRSPSYYKCVVNRRQEEELGEVMLS